MTGLIRLYRIELRTTPVRWIIPVLVAAGVFVAWTTLYPGVAYWPNALMSIEGSVALTGPAVAAAMAMVGRRDAMVNLVRRLSVRSTAPLAVVPIAAGATAVALAHALVAVAVLANVGRSNPWGPIGPWVLVAPFLALVVYCAVGYLAGRLVPHLLTAPSIGLVAYGLATWANDRQDPWGYLTPYQLHVIDVWSAWRDGFFGELTLWLTVFALLLMAIAAVVNVRGVIGMGSIAVLVVLCGLAAARIMSHGTVFYEPGIPAFNYVCRGNDPEICIHPAFATGLDEVSAELIPLNERLQATPGRFTRLVQRPRGVGQDPGAGNVAFHLDGLTETHLSGLVPELVFDQMDAAACAAAAQVAPGTAALSDVVSSYLISGTGTALPGAEKLAAAINAADPETISSWLDSHWDDYTTCSLDPGDLP